MHSFRHFETRRVPIRLQAMDQTPSLAPITATGRESRFTSVTTLALIDRRLTLGRRSLLLLVHLSSRRSRVSGGSGVVFVPVGTPLTPRQTILLGIKSLLATRTKQNLGMPPMRRNLNSKYPLGRPNSISTNLILLPCPLLLYPTVCPLPLWIVAKL